MKEEAQRNFNNDDEFAELVQPLDQSRRGMVNKLIKLID